MDTVTHGLTGYLISRSLPKEWSQGHPRIAAAVVTAGSVLPDADHAASLLGSDWYLRVHRGLSHSLFGIPATSLLFALLLARFGPWKDRGRIFLLVLIGQFSHVMLDLLNSYGTQLLQPFSDARFALDLLFVVDLVFTGIVVAGIALSRRDPRRARAALCVLTAYVGVAALLHAEARNAVRDAAMRWNVKVVSAQALPALPYVSLPSLDRLAFAAPAAAGTPSTGRPGGDGAVRIPFPAGPVAWNGFIDDGRTFLRADVDPLSGRVSWRQRTIRGPDVPEVRALRGMEEVETYLWFARYPVVKVTSEGNRKVLAFSDLRFGEMKGRRPFRLRVIEDPGAPPRVRWGW